MAKTRSNKTSSRLRLKPADSFDLIRLLARSQYDPRKAVCELVQNSLDARARHIHITWFTEKGARALRVWDDGEGVFPELGRADALRRIATTIGHSHKRSLTPSQRRELMALGKYGIGLLGFWAVGRVMVIRSRVGGGEAWRLRLREDSPEAQLERAPGRRLDETSTYTEVTILGVHEGVQRQVRPGRMQAYLAGELRGQLLAREVEIRIRDRVARGRAPKEFRVTAQRFRGQPIAEPATLEVPGFDDARIELYLVPLEEERAGQVSLACGGSTVLDDMAEVDGTGEPRGPWDSGRLEGVIDFPELEVAPGTRRHFRPNEAAQAFLAALPPLEETLRMLLAEDDRRRKEESDRDLVRKIQRAFRKLSRMLPQYDFFEIKNKRDRVPSPDGASEGAATPVVQEARPEEEPPPDVGDTRTLFPPGPLAAVKVVPAKSRIPPSSTRTLRADPLDADKRPAAGEVAFEWRMEGAGDLRPDGGRATYAAPPYETAARVLVTALQGPMRCEAEATLDVVEDVAHDRGIPDPSPVHAPADPWRSRYQDGTWQYNTAHRDYIAAGSSEARRLRYLMHLFAKEIVLRNFGRPGDGPTLERMVEILTYLDEARLGKRSDAKEGKAQANEQG